ncbi:hypothetical protein [Sphingopyxis sp. P8]|uniref:hypothetical protein n=1 Tax=Sphingopyxis sp. P8 TaxID=2763256 RepID=UPI001D0B880D|nr:hypothetical protein [Sphingopyxis sp. P8]
MSGDDWLSEYERMVADLPAPVPMAQWTEEEARAHADAAFHEAPAALKREELLGEARRQARAAKTPRRIEGIRRKSPELADLIQEDLEHIRRTTLGADDCPFDLLIQYWYWLYTRDDDGEGFMDFLIRRERGGPPKNATQGDRRKGEQRTARGKRPSEPELRAAAFVLMDWRNATGRSVTATLYSTAKDDHGDDPHAPSEAVAWLADELASLDRRLGQDSRGELADYERLAFREIAAWRDAPEPGARV